MFSNSINELIDAFSQLPGIGKKSAQRLTFHALNPRNKDKCRPLAQAIENALDNIKYCQHCRMYTDIPVCDICNNPKRDQSTLCIVESPQDALAIEQTSRYQGKYFVLHGRLSPLDGIGPDDIGMPLLTERLQDPILQEVILATNTTVEGRATAHFIANQLRSGLRCSQIAQGIPLGGELEYLDGGTLSLALQLRTDLVGA